MCKSHQYTHPEANGVRGVIRTVILSRVAIGEPHFAARVDREMRRPPFGAGAGRPCDSVLVRPGEMAGHHLGHQTHQEVVIFERAQAYPEYIVMYTIAE